MLGVGLLARPGGGVHASIQYTYSSYSVVSTGALARASQAMCLSTHSVNMCGVWQDAAAAAPLVTTTGRARCCCSKDNACNIGLLRMHTWLLRMHT